MGAVEYTRGRSFENMLIIVEESQNLTASEFEMMLTRVGDKSQIIFTGDEKQNDLKGASGLRQTISLLNKMIETKPRYLTDDDLEELNKNIAVIEFTPDDVVRSGLCKAIVNIYNNN
jgi:phosphate starvation-inducible PhoH-like protein